jgi:hypothetical protein
VYRPSFRKASAIYNMTAATMAPPAHEDRFRKADQLPIRRASAPRQTDASADARSETISSAWSCLHSKPSSPS